jgi:hypothetical protein
MVDDSSRRGSTEATAAQYVFDGGKPAGTPPKIAAARTTVFSERKKLADLTSGKGEGWPIPLQIG